MLHLKSRSNPWWLSDVPKHLPELLVDHAHCEKKAAGTALGLIFAYVDHPDLAHALAEIAEEELQHFRQVLDHLTRLKLGFCRQRPSQYGERLHALVRKGNPERIVDRLLVAALIEARSCERFLILGPRVGDPELKDFYASLHHCEAGHHATYVRLAGYFAEGAVVQKRLDELATGEAEIIERGDRRPRLHS